jgi:transcriptional regulator with GAF, ATPase, and Fis domain
MCPVKNLRTPILDMSGITLSTGQRLIYRSPAMEECLKEVHIFAPLHCDMLLRAETGAGKELIARLCHDLSQRSGPFIAINCAALPEQLVEDILFGHTRGAFTGANTNACGAFEAAYKGTLFLDEFGELRKSDQAKVLRVLQEKRITRIGEWGKEIPIDVRVIAATNVNMPSMVENGSFRLDLVHRFKKDIIIPPLRERRQDIVPLVEYFLDQFSSMQQASSSISLSPSAWAVLMQYDYPGNVRELEKIIFLAAAYAIKSMPFVITGELLNGILEAEGWKRVGTEIEKRSEETAIEISERHEKEWMALLMRALQESDGDMKAAARRLGMPYHRFFRAIKRHNAGTEAPRRLRPA